MIEFWAEDSFNIKGRGIVYTGLSTIDDEYLNKEIRIYYKDQIIEGIVLGLEARAIPGRTLKGRPIGIILRNDSVKIT
jgi:hypothetical protein